MNASTRRRLSAVLLTLVAAALCAATVVSTAQAQGPTWQQLEAQGWTCVIPPLFPDRVACFEPGRGRPFPGNPDPRPTYTALDFSRVSGELLFTVHLIRDDLYRGQPCGDHDYIFRALIGYWECVHD